MTPAPLLSRPTKASVIAVLAALSFACVIGAAPAHAQLAGAGGGDKPVDIDADNALEWHQKELAYVARGHARATQGDTTVFGDVLTAYYREEPGSAGQAKTNKIYQMVAEGNVRIVSPQRQVDGDRAVYDADRKIMIVTGGRLKLTTPDNVVTARDSLEYFEDKQLLVARGDAVAVKVSNGDRIKSDVLLGRITKGPDGSDKMDRIDGNGHVVVITDTDVAQADKLVYSVADDVAVLIDNVRITRGDNQLNGQTAEMNMKTKVNRMISGPDTGGRVKALFVPEKKSGAADAKPTPAAPASPASGKPGTR